MKKKIFSIGLRVVIAAVGLSYVAYALTWTDHVLLPDGYVAGDVTLPTGGSFKVIERTTATWTVRAGDQSVTIPADSKALIETGGAFQPGVITTCRQADWRWLVVAFVLTGLVLVVQSLRWRVLMTCRGLPAPLLGTFRIYMVGLFFNSFMPGTTGGDVMKCYYVARRSDRRAVAVMSVVADRVAGLVALVIVAGLGALIAMGGDEVGQRELTAIAVVAGAIVLAAVVYFVPVLQKALGMTWLMSKLPQGGMLASVAEATTAYRDHKSAVVGAVSLGVVVHVLIVSTAILTGWALGITTPVVKMVALLPLVMMAGSLPLSFMGLGVMEPTGMALFGDGTAALNNQIVVMLVLIRLYQVLYSAIGALFLMRGKLDLEDESDEAAG